VEDNGLGFLDPDFWAEGYTLRDRQTRESVNVDSMLENIPVFICNVAADVLGAGKAVGLLRAMESEDEAGSMTTWMDKWKSFESLVWIHDKSSQIVATSIEELARLVHDELNPQFVAAQAMLTKVIIEDCDLWQHIHAIEDCYLMRRGDTMSHFLDKLFAKV
jgi:gamma-tubulin complex component 5